MNKNTIKLLRYFSSIVFLVILTQSCNIIKKPLALKNDDSYAPINTDLSVKQAKEAARVDEQYNTNTTARNNGINDGTYANRFNTFNNRCFVGSSVFVNPYSMRPRFGFNMGYNNPYQMYNPYFSSFGYNPFGYNPYNMYNPYGYNNYYGGRNSNYYGTSSRQTFKTLNKRRRISTGSATPSRRSNNNTVKPIRRTNTNIAPTRRNGSGSTTTRRTSSGGNSSRSGSGGSKSSGGRTRR